MLRKLSLMNILHAIYGDKYTILEICFSNANMTETSLFNQSSMFAVKINVNGTNQLYQVECPGFYFSWSIS